MATYNIPDDVNTGDTVYAEGFNESKNSIDALKGGVEGDSPTRTVEEINTLTNTYSDHSNLSNLTVDVHTQYMPTASGRDFSEIIQYNDNKVFTDDKDIIAKKYADDKFYYPGNIVGTVSESGGIPTGAIIESGSNANGRYIKYADGTMICYNGFTIASIDVNITKSMGGYRSSGPDQTLPASFIDSSYSIVTQTGDYESKAQFSTTVFFHFGLNSINSITATNVKCYYIAIGKWY